MAAKLAGKQSKPLTLMTLAENERSEVWKRQWNYPWATSIGGIFLTLAD